MKTQSIVRLIVGASICALSHPAFAQDTSSQQSGNADDYAGEIIVTAQNR